MESLLERLNKIINDNRLSNDSRLPPERELALELGISRRMLRRGLERLEATGKIWRHRGKGTFVGSRSVAETGREAWTESVCDPREVLDARLELEPNLAALAAVRATAAEVRHIEWCLTRSRTAIDLETFELWDQTLHRAVAESAHNSLLLALYDVVSMARSRTYWGRLQDAAVRRCGLESIAAQHSAFIEAIAQRDPIQARHRMHVHITTLQHAMFHREDMGEVPVVDSC